MLLIKISLLIVPTESDAMTSKAKIGYRASRISAYKTSINQGDARCRDRLLIFHATDALTLSSTNRRNPPRNAFLQCDVDTASAKRCRKIAVR